MIISIFNLDNKEQEDINIIFRNFNRKMNLKEISTIKKYINSYNRKDVTISIDDYNTNIEDIFYLMNERKIPYLYVKTENENIKDIIKKLNQEAKVIYESTNNDDSKISLRKEDYLIYKSQNKYIKFAQSEKNRYAIFFESEEDGVHPRNILTIEEYKKICNIIERYKCFLKEYNAIHNLWTIYYLIGKHIDYAFNEDGDPERNNRYHSIKGAILEKKAVCQGYTDLLAFCLESIGIENIIVKGRNKFEKENAKTTMFDMYFKDGVTGEKILVFRTDVRKKYKHELEDGEKFITEARMYHKMDLDYYVKCFNVVVVEGVYLEDGYTSNVNKTFFKYPKGYYQYFKEILNRKEKKVRFNKRLYALKHYILFEYLLKSKINIGNIKSTKNKFLYFLLVVPGRIKAKVMLKK